MSPAEAFTGPDLLVAHDEGQPYPTDDVKRIPLKVIHTKFIKVEPSGAVRPYCMFKVYPEGFVICLN